MSKHTPGPWEVHDGNETVCAVTGEDLCMIIAEIEQHANAEANARLIAAAPDLLRTLRDLLGEPESFAFRAAAHKAIAEAEGR